MRFVAFLRGMNLGGRRIKNPELCAAVERIGFDGAPNPAYNASADRQSWRSMMDLFDEALG